MPGIAPVKERLAQLVKTAVASITEANGYNQDLTAARPTRLGFTDDEIPEDLTVLVVQDDPERNEDYDAAGGTAPILGWNAIFILIAFVINSDDSDVPIDQRINYVEADLIKRMLDDPYWNDGTENLAHDTHILPSEKFDEDRRLTGVAVPVAITYRTPENDPYTLA